MNKKELNSVDTTCEYVLDTSVRDVQNIQGNNLHEPIALFVDEVKKRMFLHCNLYKRGRCSVTQSSCQKQQDFKKEGYTTIADLERTDVLRVSVNNV